MGAGGHANLTYGSDGTSLDCYMQTTFDQGSNWEDVMNFHFAIAAMRLLQKLSRLTPVLAAAIADDGTLVAKRTTDGFLGSRFRVKYVVAGHMPAATFESTRTGGCAWPFLRRNECQH